MSLVLSAMAISIGILQSFREPLTSQDERSGGCTGRGQSRSHYSTWHPAQNPPTSSSSSSSPCTAHRQLCLLVTPLWL